MNSLRSIMVFTKNSFIVWRNTQYCVTMNCIFGCSYPLKILRTVIKFIPVYVIYLRFV